MYYLLIPALFLLSCASPPQGSLEKPLNSEVSVNQDKPPSTDSNLDSEKIIRHIRMRQQEIDAHLDSMKRSEHIVEISPEGGEVVVFKRAGKIQKITAELLYESGREKKELYFDFGNPFFIYIQRTHYKGYLGQKGGGETSSIEDKRLYFDNGHLIKFLKGKKELNPSNEEFKEMEQSQLEDTSELLKAIAASKP